MIKEEIIISNSEQETVDAGFEFAKKLKPSDIVLLYGDLGAGKTEFCKGICRYFDVESVVTSPTFTIINQYYGVMNGDDIIIYHIDLYRLKSRKEIDEIGLSEFLNDESSIKMVEWPEKNEKEYPDNSIKIYFTFDSSSYNKRIIKITEISEFQQQ